MDYVLLLFAVVAAWAVLRVIGGERERRVRDLAYTVTHAPADSAAPAPANGAPVRSKPAR